MSARFSSALYVGRVMHRRLKPVSHRLEYKVFSMLLDLDEVDAVAERLRLFSRNRFNLYSLHDRDFGDGERSGLANRTRRLLSKTGIDASGPLQLLFYPRILGYAFNPLAVYYCHGAQGALTAILYEVRNTFGGKHSYLIPVEDEAEIIRQAADKRFHVSPFMPMETRYHFRLTRPGDEITVAIRQTGADGAILNAAFTGVREELSDRALVKAFVRYPLMTAKVIAAIHWEAIKLLAKGMRLRKSGPPPKESVTLVRTERPRRAA